MRPDLFLATIGRGSNGSNALEVTEDRAAVTAESQDNIINRVNNISQYGPSWHYVPGIGVAGTAYAEVPGSALGDLTYSRASSKTRTNSAGVVETIAANVPPHDYRNADGTLSTFPRLNLEPQRVNSIRNSSMVGAVAGTPGTLPTNWDNVLNGLTRTVVGAGTENGLPYIDVRLSGTATGTSADIRPESFNVIAAATGQTWSASSYFRVVAAPAPPSAYVLAIYERTSGGAAVAIGTQNFTPTSTIQRFTFTRTLTGGATVAFVQPIVNFALTNGTAYDFTIRIAAPQMELGAYATTWVPTTTAAVTRLADVASKTGVSSLIGQTEGTLFVDVNLDNRSGTTYFSIAPNLSSAGNYIGINFSSTIITAEMSASFTTQAAIQFYNSSTGNFKIAFAYKQNDLVMYVNGVLVGTDTSATVPTCSQIGIFNYFQTMALKYTQAALFTTRLTNAQLAQMTTL